MAKITLVQANTSYAKMLVGALTSASLDNFSFFEEPVTVDREVAYIERVRREGNYLFLIFNDSKNLIGTIGLHEVDTHNKTARVGLTIFGQHDRGKHYGRSAMFKLIDMAFLDLGLEKLYANVIASNQKQIEWDLYFGFHIEGYLNNEYLLRGKRHDMVRLALHKAEWLNRPHKEDSF